MKKKEHIPLSIKNAVWQKYSIYPLNKEITQCCTCMNFVLIPESIRQINGISHEIQPIYINGKRKIFSGVAEYGHIISEKNGGKALIDNLIIQCKHCNTRQGVLNIEMHNFTENCEMIDAEYDNSNTEMGENSSICYHFKNNQERCKNKPVFNRRFCHIFLNS